MRRTLKWLLPIILALLVYMGLRYDASLYSELIGQVQQVSIVSSHQVSDENENQDRQTTQHAKVRLLNSNKQGQTISVTNTYSQSGALDDQLKVGQQIFLDHESSTYTFKNIKRDAVLGGLLVLTIGLIAVVMRRKTWVTLISIILNTLIFFGAIRFEIQSKLWQAWWLFVGLAIIFTVLTTVFIVGFKPVAWTISLATLLSTALAVGLGYGVLALTQFSGIHFEEVKYVTQTPQLLFFAQIIIGSLGAVLDETSDISVAIFQLNATPKARFTSGMAIGRSVMGPLIAVLFMIFMADTFTESILWIRNGNSIAQTVSWVMGLGFAQSLISAFGIVLAVPITSGLASWFGRKQVA